MERALDTEIQLDAGVTTVRDALLEGWLVALAPDAPPPSERVRQFMQEVSFLFREYLDQPAEDLEPDIRACSRSLAMYLLDGRDKREWISDYRNALEASVLRHARLSPNATAKILRFMRILTDEFWAAYADQFRLKIRVQQRQALGQELRLAKEIQSRLLPKRIPRVPGFDIAGLLLPASEVGGDYWSCKYYEADGIVTMKLADIAGHGLAAAMLVSAVKFISGGWYRGARSPATVMENTNRVLVKETPADILVTMFYAWLRPSERVIEVVNAGHHPVLHCRGTEIAEIPPTGPVLGLIESGFREERIELKTGDLIFCCSDGVIEARKQEPFGTERLKETLRKNLHLSAKEICDTVVSAVQRFSDQRQDDISMIAVKALDPPAALSSAS
jgi:serine phosphatase RsbU (regulator of sigma subunit)